MKKKDWKVGITAKCIMVDGWKYVIPGEFYIVENISVPEGYLSTYVSLKGVSEFFGEDSLVGRKYFKRVCSGCKQSECVTMIPRAAPS